MGTFYFPLVEHLNELSDTSTQNYCEKLSTIDALDSLGAVAVRSIEMSAPTRTPYIDLVVPLTYKLNEYRPDKYDLEHVPVQEHRLLNLRCGSEDELDMLRHEHPESIKRDNQLQQDKSGIIDFISSGEVDKPIDYPLLHIFVIFKF
jgi:hypothetical protein